MIIKKVLLLCAVSLMSLSACEKPLNVSPSFPALPNDVMQPPEDQSMVAKMVEATSGEGIREDYLVDVFAAEAEEYRLRLIAAQSFIRQTWETR